MLLQSRTELIGWAAAILIVAAMGVLVFTGPYHHVNKPAVVSSLAPVKVQIVTDPVAIGRYVPKTVTVHLNQQVIFTNVSNAIHTATANDRTFDSGNIGTGSISWTYIPKKMGTFPYFCAYHPLMHGVLIVKT